MNIFPLRLSGVVVYVLWRYFSLLIGVPRYRQEYSGTRSHGAAVEFNIQGFRIEGFPFSLEKSSPYIDKSSYDVANRSHRGPDDGEGFFHPTPSNPIHTPEASAGSFSRWRFLP